MTPDQRKVIEFAVTDQTPDEWWAHAQAFLGATDAQRALEGKVEKYQAAYDKAIAAGAYKTGQERKAEWMSDFMAKVAVDETAAKTNEKSRRDAMLKPLVEALDAGLAGDKTKLDALKADIGLT